MGLRFDFPFFLTVATFLTGLVYLVDHVYWAKRRPAGQAHVPVAIDWCRSFFPVLLLVWGVRSFWVQPYRVPSGSLEPTVLQGDFLLATQYNYGVFFPIGHKKIFSVGEPKRGDIALFYPPESSGIKVLYVKRVIGLPGDRVQYRDKQLRVNGEQVQQDFVGLDRNYIHGSNGWIERPAGRYQVDLFGVKHAIFLDFDVNADVKEIDSVVPPGHYFMMGDNRDFSQDSRSWGAVPAGNLVGKAWRIVMSWDPFDASVPWYRLDQKIRWQRLGTKL